MSITSCHFSLAYERKLLLCNFCRLDDSVLNVGEELKEETLPLRMGSRVYQLQGLKSLTWYEVKISYPASVRNFFSMVCLFVAFSFSKTDLCFYWKIPASFSLQLKKGNSDSGLNRNRRVLNTEKLIFKTDSLDMINDQVLVMLLKFFDAMCEIYTVLKKVIFGQDGLYILVTVEPEGFVAIPNTKEREFIIFNIGKPTISLLFLFAPFPSSNAICSDFCLFASPVCFPSLSVHISIPR